MSLMGVDVGTTGVKAVVFDESGNMLVREYREYSLLFPFPGAAELDSEAVVKASHEVIAAAAGKVKNSDPVCGIGIASQGEAFTPITSDGLFIGNIMTSSDSRAADLVGPWSEAFGMEKLYRITGHTPYPMYSLYKILWLKRERPQVWEKIWKLLFTQDLVAYTLTGQVGTEYAMAARSMLFDVEKLQWSTEVLEAAGIPLDMLPQLRPSGGIVGTVKESIAGELGLTSDVTVSVCGHDQPVGGLGCGAAAQGKASYSIGTVECICPALGSPVFSSELMNANLAMYPHVLDKTYTTVAFNVTGGSVLKWLRDNIATQEVAEARQNGVDPYERITADASDKPSDVVLLPHFGPTGTPHFDAKGAGVLFGLKLSTNRSEVFRAFLEGITYEMKWNLSILADAGFELTELRAVGGGSNSSRWMQIKADVLGVPLTTMRVTESTCMGAALLAGQGRGMWDAGAASETFAQPIKTYEPDEQNTRLYNDRFAIYQEIYKSLGKARDMLYALQGGQQ